MNASNTASRAMLVALFVSVIGFHIPTARTEDTTQAADETTKVYDKPSFLSEYDIATRDDLRLSYHIRPLVSGDLAEGWPILEGVEDQLGEWVTQFISAPRIASTITQAMPIGGQPALRKIDLIVEDCCRILHVEKPVVYVRNSPFTHAYVTQAGQRYFLVLTSGLLEKFEGAPDELRFIIGHELGHLKCGHLPTYRAAYGLLTAVKSVNLAVVPDKYQAVVPTLGLGRLFSWSRESEISADRAGLLCCQEPRVAYNALLRLLSGIGANSMKIWMVDPESPDFNADEVIKQFHVWENEPFVKFVMKVQEYSAESPFIPERLAALKMWAESGNYKVILGRTEADRSNEDQVVVIKTIKVYKVAGKGKTADPYVIAYNGERRLFTTTTSSSVREAGWKDISQAHRCRNGQPVFFEVWDSNWGRNTLIAGFVIYPVNPQHDPNRGSTSYTASLVWDWKERSSQTRSGLAEVEIEFHERAK